MDNIICIHNNIMLNFVSSIKHTLYLVILMLPSFFYKSQVSSYGPVKNFVCLYLFCVKYGLFCFYCLINCWSVTCGFGLFYLFYVNKCFYILFSLNDIFIF